VARATKADKARLLNVAYRLLGRQTSVADAARRLADTRALSRRQAYRYLQQAAALRAPVPTVAPTVAITLKLPVHTVRALRVQARRRGLTIGQIVTEALAALLGSVRRRRG
jgi:predicted DNA-binding transcriptional regulator YafY